jgi:hypothetical protein
MAKVEKHGVLFCRAPVVNLARDGRWGRNIETPGVYTHTAKGTHTHTHTSKSFWWSFPSFVFVTSLSWQMIGVCFTKTKLSKPGRWLVGCMSCQGRILTFPVRKRSFFFSYMNGSNFSIQTIILPRARLRAKRHKEHISLEKIGAFANEYLAGEYATNFVKGFQESNVDEDHLLVRAGTSNDIENGVFFALIPTW